MNAKVAAYLQPVSGLWGDGMAMMKSALTRDDGVQLHWWSASGDATRPLVVFTHGGAMDHEMWESQVAAFAPRYRVLTHDVRGHGLSKCSGAQFFLDSACDDLIALIEAAGAESAVLVGHSFGATISQLLAVRHPEKVRALVGIGAACATMPQAPMARMRQSVNPLALSLLGQTRVREMFASMAGTTGSVKEYARTAIGAVSDDVFAAIMRTGFGHPVKVPQDYALGVPLLLLQGEKEPYGAFLGNSTRWAERDGAELITVPGAAHNANQDAPDFVNSRIGAFLRGLEQ